MPPQPLHDNTVATVLRYTIQIRKAGHEAEALPMFFQVDTIAQCGPSLKGEFGCSLKMTDMSAGWVRAQYLK